VQVLRDRLPVKELRQIKAFGVVPNESYQ